MENYYIVDVCTSEVFKYDSMEEVTNDLQKIYDNEDGTYIKDNIYVFKGKHLIVDMKATITETENE